MNKFIETGDKRFFATCKFCHKTNQLIVFAEEWKGQTGSDNKWVKKGSVLLCSPCANDYRLITIYDERVEEMCEVLDAR